jgi:hypothetical protein
MSVIIKKTIIISTIFLGLLSSISAQAQTTVREPNTIKLKAGIAVTKVEEIAKNDLNCFSNTSNYIADNVNCYTVGIGDEFLLKDCTYVGNYEYQNNLFICRTLKGYETVGLVSVNLTNVPQIYSDYDLTPNDIFDANDFVKDPNVVYASNKRPTLKQTQNSETSKSSSSFLPSGSLICQPPDCRLIDPVDYKYTSADTNLATFSLFTSLFFFLLGLMIPYIIVYTISMAVNKSKHWPKVLIIILVLIFALIFVLPLIYGLLSAQRNFQNSAYL